MPVKFDTQSTNRSIWHPFKFGFLRLLYTYTHTVKLYNLIERIPNAVINPGFPPPPHLTVLYKLSFFFFCRVVGGICHPTWFQFPKLLLNSSCFNILLCSVDLNLALWPLFDQRGADGKNNVKWPCTASTHGNAKKLSLGYRPGSQARQIRDIGSHDRMIKGAQTS